MNDAVDSADEREEIEPEWKAGTPFGDFLMFFGESGWVWPLINICSRVGVFHADPNRCILARPVDSRVPEADLLGFADLKPSYRLPDGGLTGEPDAWHIIYASGGIDRFFDLATVELPKILWQRDGQGSLREFDFQKTKRRIHGIKTTQTTGPVRGHEGPDAAGL